MQSTTILPGYSSNMVEAGQQLDHYRLDELIAESTFTRTFRATDQRDGRVVAIKVPQASLEADPTALDRFNREEEIGIALNHPDVMRIFHEPHRSRLYMVTEWCEGRSLQAILKQSGKLSPESAIHIAIGILRALEYIHQHGVAHRDLQPEHIMVDEHDRIKLIDFGFASRQGARRVTFTSLSQVLGTPEYISPEQVKGKRGDARSDLYALGIMLWKMLMGCAPFTGRSPVAIMNARLSRNPPPLRLVDFPLGAQLQEVVCRATEREPRNRYASAHEFAGDLEHLDQVGVAHRPELTQTGKRNTVLSRILLYSAIIVIPVALFLVMLLLSRR
ncbi:MAG TPA: serine/threonine-protein kinase [Terracidiphilus sp.]|jgi:serine/threonine-protein kinase